MFTLQLGPQAAEYNFSSHSARQRVLSQRTETLYNGHVQVKPYVAKADLPKAEMKERLKTISADLYAPIHNPATSYDKEATLYDESYDPYASMVGLPPGKLHEPKSISSPYVSHVKPGSRSRGTTLAASASPIKRERPLVKYADEDTPGTQGQDSREAASSRDLMMSFQDLLLSASKTSAGHHHHHHHHADDDSHLGDDDSDTMSIASGNSSRSSVRNGSSSSYSRRKKKPNKARLPRAALGPRDVFVANPGANPGEIDLGGKYVGFDDGQGGVEIVCRDVLRFNLDVLKEKRRR